MPRVGRVIVAVLLSLCWLSLARKLWPLPAERVSEIEGVQFEPREWLPDEANSRLGEIAKPPAWAIWVEWLRQRGPIVLGLVGAVMLLPGRRLGFIVIAASSWDIRGQSKNRTRYWTGRGFTLIPKTL